MVTSNLVELTNLAALQAAGIHYPRTVHAWRWLFRCRKERGLELAFIRVGRRVLVDPPRYLELIRSPTPSHTNDRRAT